MFDRAMINWISKQPLVDPKLALKKLRSIERAIAPLDIPQKVKSLRTNALKRDRETLEAALFCYGLSERLNHPILFCPVEASDFDFVGVWQSGSTRTYVPVQLKELAPHSADATSELQKLIDSLVKYRDITVAIRLNKTARIEMRNLIVPDLKIEELWIYGASSHGGSRWFLYGDMLYEDSKLTYFDYPE